MWSCGLGVGEEKVMTRVVVGRRVEMGEHGPQRLPHITPKYVRKKTTTGFILALLGVSPTDSVNFSMGTLACRGHDTVRFTNLRWYFCQPGQAVPMGSITHKDIQLQPPPRRPTLRIPAFRIVWVRQGGTGNENATPRPPLM